MIPITRMIGNATTARLNAVTASPPKNRNPRKLRIHPASLPQTRKNHPVNFSKMIIMIIVAIILLSSSPGSQIF